MHILLGSTILIRRFWTLPKEIGWAYIFMGMHHPLSDWLSFYMDVSLFTGWHHVVYRSFTTKWELYYNSVQIENGKMDHKITLTVSITSWIIKAVSFNIMNVTVGIIIYIAQKLICMQTGGIQEDSHTRGILSRYWVVLDSNTFIGLFRMER